MKHLRHLHLDSTRTARQCPDEGPVRRCAEVSRVCRQVDSIPDLIEFCVVMAHVMTQGKRRASIASQEDRGDPHKDLSLKYPGAGWRSTDCLKDESMAARTAVTGRKLMTAFTLTLAFLNKHHQCFVRGFTYPSRPLRVTRRLLSAGQGDGWGADGGFRDSGPPAVPPEGMAEHLAAVEKFEMEVLYHDEHIVAVNKPPGLLCVAGVFAGKKDSLAALVAQQFRHRDVARTVVHR